MKRLQFMAALVGMTGVARAQQWKECVSLETTSPLLTCTGKTKTALNNQCPVCGTLAAPYVRPLTDKNGGFMRNCKPAGEFLVSCDPPQLTPSGPPERVTRCKRCNAAFWQDAETVAESR